MTGAAGETTWIERLRRALVVDDVVELAQALIRCPTVNPPGDEAAAARLVEARLHRLAVHEVDVVEAASGRLSVLARWGIAGGRTLVWNGHLDVVPAGDERDWAHPPFAGVVADGKLTGRGAVDMKGSVACVLHALEMIERAGLRPPGEVFLQIVADEETGGVHGSGYLAERGLLGTADGAICGEPTSLDAYVAARGRLWLEITTLGVAAHAAYAERGTNAISAMGHVLEALARLELPRDAHPYVGRPSLTPTTISGGTAANSVPDRCTLALDRRVLPSEQADAALAQIEELLARLREEQAVESRLVERARFEASEVDEQAEVVRAVRDATEAITGRRPGIGGMAGSTDARYLAAAGVPTVIFGPGDVAQAHTTDESIPLDELARGALAYAATICRFLAVD